MSVLVAGFGSPHGDDRAAWEIVARLRARAPEGVRLITLADPLRLLDELAGVERLILVDACRAGLPPGSVVRLEWPDPAIQSRHAPSTHGFSVAAVLALAQQLGRLPPRVVVLGIEAGPADPLEQISPPVARALPEVCLRVLRELDVT